MPSIFLSHSHPDKVFARKLANDLRLAGHVVWIDEAEINIGDSLIEKIRDGLDRVDYVAALLSKISINSQWVQKELDITSNREIDEKRVIALPLLLEDVELPGFLKGKLYGDFRKEDQYDETLHKLLDALGPAAPLEDISQNELEHLKRKLELANKVINYHTKDQQHRAVAISSDWSPTLREAVDKANKRYPEYRQVDEAYAFEIGDISVTVDYLLNAVMEQLRGGNSIDELLTKEDKWQEAKLMLNALDNSLNLRELNG
ncbi:MAG: toll/interleukin-1 receptor domain-containing protein [Deltaproteobacteria bacterium]|nr:toll/interleukin-1 receptor domain-containing protein [Deltaproteobacteria bacterium]